jgi:anti-sigma-K factor RskA
MSADVHMLSGAYALNALAPEEAAEFRRHLVGCPSCRKELRELQAAAARIGAAQAVTPPPQLKSRILAAAARTPQHAPSLTPVAGSPAAGPSNTRLRWLAAAAAVVILAGGGAVGIRALLDGGEPRLSPAAVQVFDADDARTMTVETANGGRLIVGVSASRGEMALDTRDLPKPGEGRVYQLWAIHGEDVESAAVLEDLDDGAAMGIPAEDTTVALTVEPSGGSEQPTSDPLVQIDPHDV